MSTIKRNHYRRIIFRSVIVGVVLLMVIAVFDFAYGLSIPKTKIVADNSYYNNVMAYDRAIALTFDDGPDPATTPQIINILKKHEVPATFFFTGSQALKHPELVRLVNDTGFEIGNHTFSHSLKVHTNRDRLKYELDITNKIIGNIIGKSLILYRPPYLMDIGSDPIPDMNEHSQVLDWVMEAGYLPVGSDIDSLDWKAKNKQEIVNNVLANLGNGHIVLLHDGHLSKLTPGVLDTLIPELKARDYRFVTVSDIIGINAAPSMKVAQELSLGAVDDNTNGDVTRLQNYLLKEGYFLEEPTGTFDALTRNALMAWQKNEGITEETGEVGVITISAINNDLSPISGASENWPSLFSRPEQSALQHNFQKAVMKTSSAAGNNIGGFTTAIIVLVLMRLLLISLLYAPAGLFPQKHHGHWRGGASVIIPVFNEAENIAATVGSVLQSTRKKIEVIVVDDGSKDNSADIVAALMKKYRGKLKLIRQPNSGKAAALNRGIAEAKYGVVVTIDGDSILAPDALKHLLQPFKDHRIGAVAGKVRVADSNSLISYYQRLEYLIIQNIDKTAFARINAVGVVPGPIGAWRKSVLLKLRGFSDDTLVEDQDMTLAVLAAGKKVIYEPLAVAYTETPFRLRDFFRQRLRWVFGSIQCLAKYHRFFLRPASGSLGIIVLPHTLIYSVILPLFYPLIDILFVAWLIFNFTGQMWLLVIIFVAVDFVYAIFAFSDEAGEEKFLILLPFQRVFYRLASYYIVLVSLARAIEGSEMLWNRVIKRGDTKNLYHELNGLLAVKKAG